MEVLRSEVSLEARNDLARQWDWYAEHAGEDIAERYLKSFQATLSELSQKPDLGRLRRFRDARLERLRSRLMQGAFRVHLVFYRIDDNVLVIFRVLHGMRDLPKRLLD